MTPSYFTSTNIIAILALFFLVNTASVFASPKQAKPMSAVDILSMTRVQDAVLSADGSYIAFEKNKPNWNKNIRESQLWLYNVTSQESKQLTFSSAPSTDPFFSNDGRYLFFLSKREKDDRRQLYKLSMDGGEAKKVFSFDFTPSNLVLTKDDRYLYFTGIALSSKARQKQIKKKQVIEQFENPDRQRQLWRVDLNSGELHAITNDTFSVRAYALSTNEQQIVYLKAKGVLLDQRHTGELFLSDNLGKNAQGLTQNNFAEQGLSFSPNDKWIAFTATVNNMGDPYYNKNIFLLHVKTGKVSILAEDLEGEVINYAWSGDSKQLYVLQNIGVSNHLFEYDIENKQITQLTAGDWTISDWAYDSENQQHLIRKTSPIELGDYWLANEKATVFQRVTSEHAKLSHEFTLPKQEKLTWKSHDGYLIEGLLVYPVNYKKGHTYPLVTQTHGGPRSSDQFGIWSTGSYMPVLAGMGYAILRVNHRGGTGYSDQFLRSMMGGYFKHAHLDVLSGIDYLIDEGIAAPDKLVKMGWSAGAHMTNKLLTETTRFKAASSGAGAVEWMSMYGETDTSYGRTPWFGSKPWSKGANLDNYRNHSPLHDLWKVTTPTLIFVGQRDQRVPSTQSKILFRALRDVGVDTELYIAPDESHGFKKLSHRLFKINKELAWFEHYVKGHQYTYVTPY